MFLFNLLLLLRYMCYWCLHNAARFLDIFDSLYYTFIYTSFRAVIQILIEMNASQKQFCDDASTEPVIAFNLLINLFS